MNKKPGLGESLLVITFGLLLAAIVIVVMTRTHAHANEPELVMPCRGEFGQRC